MIDTINSGEFRHRIIIQKHIQSKDEDGIPSYTWEMIHECKAKIINTSAKEYILNQGVMNENTKKFTIRYPKLVSITNENRLIYNDIAYNILYASDIQELHKYLEIVAEVIK